jgi:hypothetical protein
MFRPRSAIASAKRAPMAFIAEGLAIVEGAFLSVRTAGRGARLGAKSVALLSALSVCRQVSVMIASENLTRRVSKMLDLLFSNYRWYRKLRGGHWIQVRLRPIPYMTGWFRNTEPSEVEIVEATEDYGADKAT